MTEKRYLNWYNKVGYGSGDIAGNVVYAFLTFFVMIYLSDTIGLDTGIVGTLMAVAKIFDGVSDVIFGSLIDKTHTKMGKARPWMLWPYLGCGVCLFAIFSKRIDGTMYSCTSLGVKIGGGLGTAISGWLLAASGFIEGGVATQPESVLTMLNVMYLWLPMIFCALVTFLLTKLNVEKANAKLLEAKN